MHIYMWILGGCLFECGSFDVELLVVCFYLIGLACQDSALCNIRDLLSYCSGAGPIDVGFVSVGNAFKSFGQEVEIKGIAATADFLVLQSSSLWKTCHAFVFLLCWFVSCEID
jgi:hypothetical protein